MKMNLKIIHSIILVSAVVCCGSCKRYVQDINNSNADSTGEKLLKINKYLVEKDSVQIEKYISGKKWQVTKTETALRYEIYKHGNGKKAEKGKTATINYRVELPDGKLCYSSDSLGPKTFTIGKGGVESGLEEGLLLMREGDRAHLVLPPHLAYGLSGDQDKIGPRAIIIYDIELLSVK